MIQGRNVVWRIITAETTKPASRGLMEVVVKLSDDLREQAGTNTIRVPINDDETVDTLLMKLSRRYPKLIETLLDPTTGEIKKEYEILLNGKRTRNIRGIYTKLKHKDEVAILLSNAESGKKIL